MVDLSPKRVIGYRLPDGWEVPPQVFLVNPSVVYRQDVLGSQKNVVINQPRQLKRAILPCSYGVVEFRSQHFHLLQLFGIDMSFGKFLRVFQKMAFYEVG